MKLKIILLLFLFLAVTFAKKHHHSSEEDEKEPVGNPAMDRLAVNLAGAFVKSIFPEMDRPTAPTALPIAGSADPVAVASHEIRRAPQHTALLQEASGPAFDTMNAFNSRYGNGAPAAPTLSAVNSPYGLQLPSGSGGGIGGSNPFGSLPSSNVPLPTSQLADMLPLMPNALNAGSGGIEAINAARRHKYLSELQQHQNQLNEYSAKQLEYLDAQRRYQQQMVDHQAGAALLMQQQQQEFLSNMKKKYANFDDVPNKEGLEDNQTGGRALVRMKSPARQHAVRTAAQEAFAQKSSHEREDFASDEYLKAFFKKVYGIEIPNDGEMDKLTAEEKETLIKLKEHLIKEAKENGIKLGAIKTMEKFSEQNEEMKHLPEGENLEKELATLSEDECGKCIAPQANKLQGSWTQIYGNPTVMKDTYSTILSIMDMGKIEESRETANVSAKHASCVGMEIGKIHHGEAPLNFFFRDDGERKELHEMNGKLAVLSNKELKLSLEYMDTKLCVVKAGPSDEPQFDYVVFAETSGTNKCSSYFVFARNVEDFNLRHYDDISDYMKTQVLNDEALPVAALPKPALCQIS